MLADLAGNEDVPFQSLLEAVETARQNRHVLLEYVAQMQQHGMEVAFMVLGLIDRLNVGDRIDLLRLIAQDLRPPVARAAIDRLGQLAADDQGRPALRALHTLQPMLAPEYAPVVERMLRKLQFAGRRYAPPAPERWRALLTPADVGAYVSVWLVRDPAPMQPETGAALGFVVNLQDGFVQFSGAEAVARKELPAPHAIGELAAMPSGSRALLLEAPFDVGRWLVQQALAAHWNRSTAAPLPDELRLYGDLVMEFAPPRLPQELAHLWAVQAPPADATPDYPALHAAAALLVTHPALRGWIQWSAAVWASIQIPAATQQDAPKAALIGVVLREIGHLSASVQLLRAMSLALRLIALWLAIANAQEQARAAVLTAAWLERLPVTENPFLQALLAADWRVTRCDCVTSTHSHASPHHPSPHNAPAGSAPTTLRGARRECR